MMGIDAVRSGTRWLRSYDAALWVACILPILYGVVTRLYFPRRFVSLIAEDGLGEMATAAFLFGAAWLVGAEAARARRDGRAWIIPALFAAGALFVGLEEASWGQRLFGYEVPWIQDVNLQTEVNLHNLIPTPFFQVLVLPSVFVGWAALGLVSRMSEKVDRFLETRNIPVPPLQSMPLLLVSATTIFFHEPAEMFFAAAVLVTAGTSRFYASSTGGPRRSLIALLACTCATLAVLEFGPHDEREFIRYQMSLMVADGYYARNGKVDNARSLLLQEARRFEGWVTVGSAAGPLATIALHEWRYGAPDEPSPTFLGRAVGQGRLYAARNSIDLAVLCRLAGKDEEAQVHLDHAEQLLREYERETAATPQPNPTAVQARADLLACRGHENEALELVLPHVSLDPPLYRRVRHVIRIRNLSALFANATSVEHHADP